MFFFVSLNRAWFAP